MSGDTHPFGGSAFRRRLALVLLVPLVLLAIIAGVLGLLVLRLATLAGAAGESERVVAELNQLERLLIDSETGMRGFLQFGEDEFLDPTRGADSYLPTGFATLRSERLDAEQRAHLENVDRTYARWSAMSREAIAQRRAGNPSFKSLEQARERKRLMDSMRTSIQSVRNREVSRGAQREATARAATRWTLATTLGLVVGVGLVIGTITRRELARLAATYQSNLARVEAQAAELQSLTATLESHVEERTRQLREANQELEAFTYSVSHDLRAPLRHISGFSQLLGNALGSHADQQVRHYLARIANRTHEAGQLIDDLLAFSRTGRMPLVRTTVHTSALVAGVVESVASEAPSRRVDWRIGDLPPVEADPAMLRVVFTNLLSNAFKYTRTRAEATISVEGKRTPGFVVFSVSDNGVGFDMQYADKLFGVFQRLHAADEFEGTGIGLATVRRIVARHGGSTWAEGLSDQGATFYFSIPVSGE